MYLALVKREFKQADAIVTPLRSGTDLIRKSPLGLLKNLYLTHMFESYIYSLFCEAD